ncbi:MAG: hypothetical protein RLZZ312_845 [Bacteroidota bacterium]|jgi:gliding motility-associated-like protein
MQLIKKIFFLTVMLVANTFVFAQTTNQAPILLSTGNQFYCAGTALNIVTDFSIQDPDDTGIDFLYIQISEGFVTGQDILTLTGNHPNIISTWDAALGKMTLSGNGTQATYIALVTAIKAITFQNNSVNPAGNRKFSITIDQANYLPSNGHYYRFAPNIGITWANAKTAAQTTTYYGLQGYLATITAADEAQLVGKQSSGAGWIGGSDEITEGQWRWMSGPETGQNMVYTNWNTNEPNDLNGEDYAHITAVGVGILGSWNDLSNTGGTSGNYQPKGYIVEYGGMPGDPILQIATFSTITMVNISSVTSVNRCGSGSVTLTATSSSGQVNWFDAPSGGNLLATGNFFNTPTINFTTVYYATAASAGCIASNATAVTATINEIPIVSVSATITKCTNVPITITAASTLGIISWSNSINFVIPLTVGNSFNIPDVTQNTTFYVQADNNGCKSTIQTIQVNVADSPILTDQTIQVCLNERIFLTTNNAGLSHLWNTGQTTETIETNGVSSTYSVIITNSNNCSRTQNFELEYQQIPTILNVIVSGDAVQIITTTNSNFEFSIDGINFQDSNIFNLPQGGNFIAYVRDKNQCSIDREAFSIFKLATFFSPNGDSYNDTWQAIGTIDNPKFEVSVFDRFGKLLTILNAGNTTWDGSFNGQNSPADDYWYVCKLDNGQVLKGHFTLKR